MSTPREGKDRAADSGAYVLNALDAESRAAFEAQLRESDELRNEVTELNDTAVLLGMAVDPVTPPPALKESIMSKLATTPQLPREVPPVREIRPDASVGQPVAEPPQELNRKAQARWFTRPAVAMTSVAAAVALLIGGGVAVSLTHNQGTQQEQQADALASIMTAPDQQSAVASISTGGKATLEWSPAQEKAALLVHGLAPLPSDKTYELWYIDANTGTAKPAGTFNPTKNSTFQVLDGKMAEGDTVGVTVEPSGGSKQPTTKPIVAIASA
jgi:anti-sigma-K factor RskA